MKQIVFHIDVNSAFLAWEAVYRLNHLHEELDLREIPSAVGGSQESRHGIILAKSFPCKQYGIKTGESLVEAREKCPHIVIVPGNSKVYDAASKSLMKVLQEYSDNVEQYSIDEAFMDMTETIHLYGDPKKAADLIRERIERELGFTVNIGVSSNKLLAKMASDFEKPNKVHTLWKEEVKTKMWPLPVTELFYVGRATTAKLLKLGIYTIGDLANTDLNILRSMMKSHADVIWNYAHGNDYTPVVRTMQAAIGYGNGTTTPKDITDVEGASMVLMALSESVGARLRKDNVRVDVISTSIKYNDFSYESHQMTLKTPTNITNEIHACALQLFNDIWDQKTPIRHLNVRGSRAKPDDGYRQLSITDYCNEEKPTFDKLEKVDACIDLIRQQYGAESIKRGIFINKQEKSSS